MRRTHSTPTRQFLKNHRRAKLRYRYHTRCRTLEGSINGLSMGNANDRRILRDFISLCEEQLKNRW